MKGVANMWTRKNVKQKGKISFYANFWKCVLVALILSIVIGAAGNSGGSTGGLVGNSGGIFGSYFNGDDSNGSDSDTDDDGVFVNVDVDEDGITATWDKDDQAITEIITGTIIVAVIVGTVIILIVTALGLALQYLLLTPFEYGCRKFFRKNLDEPAKLSNIVYVFDSHYKNIVKTAFLKDLFVWLWSLLFIIPGIIKAYEYRLVPYIVSENPDINYKDALAESKKLMAGNKWKTFVLDLSFIGWDILSLCTFGLLEVFFVGPYKASTHAALYETLKYGIDAK